MSIFTLCLFLLFNLECSRVMSCPNVFDWNVMFDSNNYFLGLEAVFHWMMYVVLQVFLG